MGRCSAASAEGGRRYSCAAGPHREWPDQARHGDREGHLPTLLEARNYRGHDSTEAPRGEAAQAQAHQAEVGGIAVRLDF